MSIESEIDRFVPIALIEQTARKFLDEAGWMLEFGSETVTIPQEPPPLLISRAFIAAHASDVFLDNHFEAVLALHPEQVSGHIIAQAGYLKLYFDREGRFISEDRFGFPPPNHFV